MSESITDTTCEPDDLSGMVTSIFGLVPWKLTIFVFITFIMINTSTFIDQILNSWPGAVVGRAPSESGLVIQAMILTLGVVIMSICINGNLL